MLPIYRDIFVCLRCQMHAQEPEGYEFQCGACKAYVCEHLVMIDGGIVVCFCCYKDQTLKWPDYSYTMIRDRKGETE